MPSTVELEDVMVSMSQGSEQGRGKRRRRILSPSEKYEIWVQLLRGEASMAEAAAAHQVDRSVIVRLRQVAREGALSALAASRPGTPRDRARDLELEAVRAENARMAEAIKEMAIKLTLAEGKDSWG